MLLRAVRYLCAASGLFLTWAVLSDHRDAAHLSAGAAGSLLFAIPVWVRDKSWRLSPVAFAVYLPWLCWQILLSNIQVARLALSPRPAWRPRFVDIRIPPVRGDGALTLLGCSITLTPGTVAVEAMPDRLLVHALDEGLAREIEGGAMGRRVARVFGETPRA